MRASTATKILAALACSIASAFAQAGVVNINAYSNGGPLDTSGFYNPVLYSVGPGTYKIQRVGTETAGATYTAWNAWGRVSGCDAQGLCNGGNGWVNNFQYDTGAGTEINWLGPFDRWATPQLALNNAIGVQSYVRTFTAPTTLRFYIMDSHHWDNLGGISVSITPAIPEPETYALMLAGLGALGLMARRRKDKQLENA